MPNRCFLSEILVILRERSDVYDERTFLLLRGLEVLVVESVVALAMIIFIIIVYIDNMIHRKFHYRQILFPNCSGR